MLESLASEAKKVGALGIGQDNTDFLESADVTFWKLSFCSCVQRITMLLVFFRFCFKIS